MQAKKAAQTEIDEEEEQISIKDVEILKEHGINAADIDKLKQAGICTVKGILMATKKELLNVRGITDAKLEKLIGIAQKLETGDFLDGRKMLERRKLIHRITTGSKNLDKLLGGGIESMSVTEVFGEFRTGKTQLCHTLCVTSQLPTSQNGGGGRVIYFDTEGTFRPENISGIAERYGLNGEEVLENILVARVYTTEHMIELLKKAAALMIENTFALLIIDSIMALFRTEFSGRGELSERQQVLGKFLGRLMKFAEQFNVAVFMTNQVMSDPGGAMPFPGGALPKPVGGHVLAHASTTRLFLRKGKGNIRICKIFDSPCLPESEETFSIGSAGIEDADAGD